MSLRFLLNFDSHHQATEDDMKARRVILDGIIQSGRDLISDEHFASDDIDGKIQEAETQWSQLVALAAEWNIKLQQRRDLYQVCIFLL